MGPGLTLNLFTELLHLLSAFPVRGCHSGVSFSSCFYQLYLPPSLQPQPRPLGLYLSTICKVLGMYLSTFLRNSTCTQVHFKSTSIFKYFSSTFKYFWLFGIIFLIQKCVTGVAGISCSLAYVILCPVLHLNGPHISLFTTCLS